MIDLQCCARFWGGCQFLLQGILLTQDLNLCFLCLLPWQVGSSSHWATWEARVSFCHTCAYTHPLFSLIGHCSDWVEFLVLYTCCCLGIWLSFIPTDCSPPGSSVHGISQARTLEWLAISFSRASSGIRDWTRVSFIGRLIFFLTTEPPGKPVLYNRSLLVIYLGCYIKSMGSYCFFTWVLEFV